MTPASPRLTRRVVVGAVATLALPSVALAQTPPTNPPLEGPLAPDPVAFKKALSTFTGSATPQAEGLQLDIPVLADNPSAVPIKAKVTLPITEHDWCEELIVLAELNPTPLACRIRFTAETGSAEAAVRIRLSQSQAVHVLARMKSGKLLAGKQTITVAASGCGM